MSLMKYKDEYDLIVGLEIHLQLTTESKMFCSCNNKYFQAEPNSYTCPVCLGLPGALPVPNREAIVRTIKLGLATDSTIATELKFDRKHYFYPDLPKGYQISQYDNPICYNGVISILNDEGKYDLIDLYRIHIEEDVAKTVRESDNDGTFVLIDYNKSGVPLVEIVTKPVIHDAKTAKKVCMRIRQMARYLNISDADMEKGQMRCEPNISVQRKGSWKYADGKILPVDNAKLNPKVEIKNIGSISAVEKSIEYEYERLIEDIKLGKQIIQQTRGWNAEKGVTEFQRSKESAEDYRYFKEPDIPIIRIEQVDIETVKSSIENNPIDAEKELLSKGLSVYDVTVLTADISDYLRFTSFYSVVSSELGDSRELLKLLANIYTGPITSYLNEYPDTDLVDNAYIALFVKLFDYTMKSKIIVSKAKELVTGILEKRVLLSDLDEIVNNSVGFDGIETIVSTVLAENVKAVEDYRAGKVSVIGFLLGAVMRKLGGNGDPNVIREIILSELKK